MGRMYAFLIVLPFLLASCGEYTPSKDDVVDSHGDVENLQVLEKFMDNVSSKKRSEVRIVSYTIEGAPIIQDLAYADEKLIYTIDTREDEYGEQSVRKDMCQSIEKISQDHQTIYQVEGCKDEEDVKHVLIIPEE